MSTGTTVLLDTSVMIARENGRSIRTQVAIQSTVTSVITLAELQAGVLAAADIATRARRLTTLDSLADMTVLAVDEIAAREWARLRAHLAEAGRRMNVNDLWIASIAAAHGLPIVTQDTDFDALDGAPGVSVIRV